MPLDVYASDIYGDIYQLFLRACAVLAGEQRSLDFATILHSEKICLITEVIAYVFVGIFRKKCR